MSEVPPFPLGGLRVYRRVKAARCLRKKWKKYGGGDVWTFVFCAILLLIALGVMLVGLVFLAILAIPFLCVVVFYFEHREKREQAWRPQSNRWWRKLCCGDCCGGDAAEDVGKMGFGNDDGKKMKKKQNKGSDDDEKKQDEDESDAEKNDPGCRACCPTYMMLVWLLPVMIFISLMTGISGITHPTQYLELLRHRPEYRYLRCGLCLAYRECGASHSVSFGVSYFMVTVILAFFIVTMWRVTQLFNKARVLMCIPSRPLEIISREEADHELDAEEEPLDPMSKIVDPKFLKAWWALREHVCQKELAFFFQVCYLE